MAESTPSSIHEERPKVNWFLYAATIFFVFLFISMLDMPNSLVKVMWLLIAALNVAANGMQIYNTLRTRYVLWRRGLSIYLGNNREALIRFDKAFVFRQFKGYGQARTEARDYGANAPMRSYPAFGGRRRWLAIFERDDGERQALVFDPTPVLENLFRQHLIEADQALEKAELEASYASSEASPDAAPDAAESEWQVDEESSAHDETDDPRGGPEEATRPPQ